MLPELVKEFGDLCNVCVNVNLDNYGILNNELIQQASEAVVKISKITPRGEGNFNFSVNFNCDPLIPYFPASYHRKELGNRYCKTVQYEVCADPVDAKICDCLVCKKLHGAPMQWAAIFHKHDVRIITGVDHLHFYNNELNKHERILPCKVSCDVCGTLIADEGRRMWLAFPSLFDFGQVSKIPDSFKPSCHLFYGMRVFDMNDDLPKWSGHKNHSERL